MMILELRDPSTRKKVRALSISQQTINYGYGREYSFPSIINMLESDQTARRRTDAYPRSYGDDYHGMAETPRLARRTGSDRRNSTLASTTELLLRPSRRVFIDRYVTSYQSSRTYTSDREQLFSASYPVRQRSGDVGSGRLRYRIMSIGNGSFIDTTEEPCASGYCPSRLTTNWRPYFKRYLSSFFLSAEKEHIKEAMFKSIFDPKRYGRKVSGTCERMMEEAADVFWEAYKNGWFPSVDYIHPKGDLGGENHKAIYSIIGTREIDRTSKILTSEMSSSQFSQLRKQVKAVEDEESISSYSREEYTFKLRAPIIGPHMLRPLFAIVDLNGSPYGCADVTMRDFMEWYAGNDIHYRNSSREARNAAGAYHYVGFICPDTGHFNFSDNVCCALLISSIIETTNMLKNVQASVNRNGNGWKFSSKEFATSKIEWMRDLTINLRNGKTKLPDPIRELYDKAMSLEKKWHKSRMKISTWKSPYYKERGYS